jgi:hypothetical protein
VGFERLDVDVRVAANPQLEALGRAERNGARRDNGGKARTDQFDLRRELARLELRRERHVLGRCLGAGRHRAAAGDELDVRAVSARHDETLP